MGHNYEGCDCGRCKWIRESQAQNLRDGYAPKMSLKERLAKQRQENYAASDRAFEVARERCASQDMVKDYVQRAISDGVYVWVETIGVGHSFISVISGGTPVLYSYGRYGDDNSGSNGVLLIYENDDAFSYMRDQLFSKKAVVFNISNVNSEMVVSHYKALYENGSTLVNTYTSNVAASARLKSYGRVINTYDLSTNNCTTHTVEALQHGGFDVEGDIVIPLSFENYLNEQNGVENVSTVFNFYYSSLYKKDEKGKSLEDVITGSSVKASGEEVLKIKKWIN